MKEGRNTQGQFSKGHPGFKPKGAVSGKKQQLEQRLNLIFAQLDNYMEESIKELSPRQIVKLWLELNKLLIAKPRRIPWEPDPPKEPDRKVIFEFVNSGEIQDVNPEITTPKI